MRSICANGMCSNAFVPDVAELMRTPSTSTTTWFGIAAANEHAGDLAGAAVAGDLDAAVGAQQVGQRHRTSAIDGRAVDHAHVGEHVAGDLRQAHRSDDDAGQRLRRSEHGTQRDERNGSAAAAPRNGTTASGHDETPAASVPAGCHGGDTPRDACGDCATGRYPGSQDGAPIDAPRSSPSHEPSTRSGTADDRAPAYRCGGSAGLGSRGQCGLTSPASRSTPARGSCGCT